MPYPSMPLTKRRLTIEPQARRCMAHLGITADEVLLTMNEWESSSVVATDPLTANTLATYPETAEEIPAFYEVERTLLILDYFEQPKLRLKILLGLNKGESRNALAKAVFFYRRGELLDRTWEQQYNTASGLNLVVAAIILWNTVYLSKAIAYLRQQGEGIPDEYLKHLSPVAWEHISLTGEYVWNLKQQTSLDALRPLRVK